MAKLKMDKEVTSEAQEQNQTWNTLVEQGVQSSTNPEGGCCDI